LETPLDAIGLLYASLIVAAASMEVWRRIGSQAQYQLEAWKMTTITKTRLIRINLYLIKIKEIKRNGHMRWPNAISLIGVTST